MCLYTEIYLIVIKCGYYVTVDLMFPQNVVTRTPCEAGVMIFSGTENQQKTNFPDTPTWVLVSDTFPLCEDSHINAISLPHLKLQKKKKMYIPP